VSYPELGEMGSSKVTPVEVLAGVVSPCD